MHLLSRSQKRNEIRTMKPKQSVRFEQSQNNRQTCSHFSSNNLPSLMYVARIGANFLGRDSVFDLPKKQNIQINHTFNFYTNLFKQNSNKFQ